MHNVLTMEIVNCLEQLIDEEFNAVSVQAVRFLLQNLEEITIHELKYKVQAALPIIRVRLKWKLTL